MVDDNDFGFLAESVFRNLGDEEWSRTLYKKAEEKAESYDDFKDLAESLCEILGDKELARSLYQKAEEKAVGDERYHLVQSKNDYLGDVEGDE